MTAEAPFILGSCLDSKMVMGFACLRTSHKDTTDHVFHPPGATRNAIRAQYWWLSREKRYTTGPQTLSTCCPSAGHGETPGVSRFAISFASGLTISWSLIPFVPSSDQQLGGWARTPPRFPGHPHSGEHDLTPTGTHSLRPHRLAVVGSGPCRENRRRRRRRGARGPAGPMLLIRHRLPEEVWRGA